MTNIPTSTTTPTNDVSTLVEKMLKEFDITKMHAIGYDKLQEIATQYLASDNQELKEIGQELKDLDPKIFELSPAEEEIKQLHDILTKSGKSKDDADMFCLALLETAIKKATQDIISVMNADSLNEWQNLQSFDPNVLQQMYLLDETAKLLLGKNFDQLYDTALHSAVNVAVTLINEDKKNSKLVENLTEEQAKTIMTAFNSNQYETAIQLIYNFAEENESNK